MGRFARIAGQQLDVACVSDPEAMRRYARLGYTLGIGHLHVENDCLADSLLQCLAVKGVLPKRLAGRGGVWEREGACKSCRRHLLDNSEVRVRPETETSYLEEHLHGPHVVRFFVEYFQSELLSRPLEISLITHSRFDACVQAPETPSLICAASTAVGPLPLFTDSDGSRVQSHVFCESGDGHRGFHFSPVVQRPPDQWD